METAAPAFILVDQNTHGILAIHNDLIALSHLRKSEDIGDTDIARCKDIANLDMQQHWRYIMHRKNYSAVPSAQIYTVFPEAPAAFVEKLRLCQLRMQAYDAWRRHFRMLATRTRSFYQDIGPDIALELTRSTPGAISPAIQDYAEIVGVPALELYERLKLQFEEDHHRRLMCHAMAEKVSRQINSCVTQAEIDAVKQQMASLAFWHAP